MRSSPKKARKPQSRSLPLREAILAVVAEYERMSVRQLYYQLVSRGLPKTERAYKRVCDAAAQLRLADIARIPWQPGVAYNLTPEKEAS